MARSAATQSTATACVVQTIQTGQSLLERVQKVCRQYGVTLSIANVLAIVDGADEPLAPCDIQKRLFVTGGAVTQMLDALQQRNLIRRVANPHDRRSVLVEITAEGRRLRQEFEPELNRRDEVWMAGLQPEEQAQLAALLHKVYSHLETLSAEAA